jgi:alanine dehydrogenase
MTLLLSRSDVLQLLDLPACTAAVENAFRLHAEGRTFGPGVLGLHVPNGGFHIKAAGLMAERGYFAAKTNANFPDNPRRHGLPTIQGAVLLAAIAATLPLQQVWTLDADHARAERLAERTSSRLGLRVEAVKDLHEALRQSDVCITCTPSRRAFVGTSDVAPGTFIAAVGADSQGKQELEPALVASATLVVDVLEQCAEIGELQHALAAGLLTRADVHAELADVVSGRRPGRTRADEITVFDSSGTALQDVAAAIAVYRNARAAGRGVEVRLDA